MTDTPRGHDRRFGQRLPRFRIFLASPGDVGEERQHVRSVIEQIRGERAFRDRMNLDIIAWDQPGVAVPLEAGLTPQEAIARGMPKPSECDLVVVILWSRIGTPLPPDDVKPDGSRYLSGTEWEFHDAVTAFQKRGKPLVWLYRRNQSPSFTIDDPKLDEKREQWGLLQTFLEPLKNQDGSIAGGMNPYARPDEFRTFFEQHLRNWLTEELEGFKDAGELGGRNDDQSRPRYRDQRTKELSDALEKAYQQREEQLLAGKDTSAIDAEIRELRRQIREGGRLRASDFLMSGRYKLIEQLGYGGFATVWKSIDRKRGDWVAIKVLHGLYADDRTRRERFFHGAEQMDRLRDPGIVQVLERQLEDEGYFFFVMEYLEGGDFQQAVQANRLTIDQRLAVITTIGDALQFAHQKGVVHRDIKPANIVLDRRLQPKLTDFDLVLAEDITRLTIESGWMGTAVYAAPELVDDPRKADAASDVFGLAMTAVFALSGTKLPFTSWGNATAFIELLDVSAAIKAVLQKGTAVDQTERYPTVADFCKALRAAESSRSVPKKTDRTAPVSFRDRFLDGHGEGPEMIWLPGGTFMMGDDNSGWNDEKPAHEVTLDSFAIGQYPVTVGEFRRFVDDTGYQTEAEREDGAWVFDGKKWDKKSDANWRNPYLVQDDNHPVVCISWDDAAAYCEWLSEQTGERYSLPFEAEWEYACRASSDTAYFFGDDEQRLGKYAWYSKNAGGKTHPVGGKLPNDWQLYDICGNVFEWVRDWYEDYSSELRRNPSGPESGSDRVLRGGGWNGGAGSCRSASRFHGVPGFRFSILGFRLARRV